MRKLSDTIARLATIKAATIRPVFEPSEDRLTDLDRFGSNPGNLRARVYVPEGLPAYPALVVALHGCTQTAAGYDVGAGWSRLADEQGFVVLLPEQRRSNNAALCFNWFQPDDIARDNGEALSIRQMIACVVRDHAVDPSRVFVTGLSAGGAMASVMLATYPELFAGGAIIAGLTYGSARTVPEALDRMRGLGAPEGAALGALVRGASGHQGNWPTVSIWQGSDDVTVVPSNANAIVEQWRGLHGVATAPDVEEAIGTHRRRAWRDAAGREAIEAYDIAGMAHGVPLSTLGDDRLGVVGPHMLEAGISSTRRIAAFWGLAPAGEKVARKPASADVIALPAPRPPVDRGPDPAPQKPVMTGVGTIIENALRAAGLMR